ncbi:MAG TPA: cytochrome c oxidase assembly protein [Candidatus Competibacteraceae bacterium]|nr:cytochrome c oxidase assembly protein [Candidatus Competibacteraceae bacterium]
MSATPAAVTMANRRLLRRLLLAAAVMFGFAYALVPLYDVLCQITGLGGRTNDRPAQLAETSGAVDSSRTVTVQFVASLGQDAPWEFRPAVASLKVQPGAFYQTSFYARNLSGQPLVGRAIPSVSPGPAARYLQKIECFCFNRQDFAAGEAKDMPLAFRLDPALPDNIKTVTLSYTFFQVAGEGG